MTQHFQAYVSNFNRMRLIEMIDREAMRSRQARARASLIFNPLSGEPYSTAKPQGQLESSDHFSRAR